MKLKDATTDEIERLRDSYTYELRRETQASPDVRRSWKIVVLALDAELGRRFNGNARAAMEGNRK